MEIIEFLVIKGSFLILCGLGIFIIHLLLTIEKDIVEMSKEISQTNKQMNKLIDSLMNSLNDVRKLVHQRIKSVRKEH